VEGFCPARSGPGRRRHRFAVARKKTIEMKIDEKEMNAGNSRSDQEAHLIPRIRRFPSTVHSREQVAIGSTVLRHNLLVDSLYAQLVDEHGRAAVGTEQPSGLGGFVDAVVKRNDKRYWIYEVKVSTTASDAIRQALGQLLEYAYREGAWNPERLYVVGEEPIDEKSRKFLSRLRAQFGMPIDYRQVVI